VANLPARPIRVGLHIADPILSDRVVRALAGDPGLAVAEFDDLADVAIADHAIDDAAPLILLSDAPAAHPLARRTESVVPKEFEATVLASIVRVVAAGFAVSAAEDVVDAAPSWADGHHDDEPGLPALTARELAVLALLVEGASNKIIARQLDISPSTAKFHVASLLRKLSAHNRLDAVATGVRRGLVMI
jgi:DNA-binding CsgD family transcriptional regulator